MMPSAQFLYRPRLLNRDEFVRALRTAHERGELESYIGYESTADHVSRISGVPVPLNRAETHVQAGDIMLVCKLRYRLTDPAQKTNAVVRDEDFEYWLVEVLPQTGAHAAQK